MSIQVLQDRYFWFSLINFFNGLENMVLRDKGIFVRKIMFNM
jgi:hypothetical protein